MNDSLNLGNYTIYRHTAVKMSRPDVVFSSFLSLAYGEKAVK